MTGMGYAFQNKKPKHLPTRLRARGANIPPHRPTPTTISPRYSRAQRVWQSSRLAQAGSLSIDPLGFVDGGNLYRYVINSPISRNDPSGMVAPLLVIPIAGGGAIVITAGTAAAAVATAFGMTVLQCLRSPGCRAAMMEAIENVISSASAAVTASLRAACSAARLAYHAAEDLCGSCKKGPELTCFHRQLACAYAGLMIPCWNSVINLRLAYMMSGCDFVFPNSRDIFRRHFITLEQKYNALNKCLVSAANNCPGSIIDALPGVLPIMGGVELPAPIAPQPPPTNQRPAPTPTPYDPIMPGDDWEYGRQICLDWCRDKTLDEFLFLSDEATAYYNDCVEKNCPK